MRIVIHDYSGHAFPVQLSRWLARQGHDVLHLYSADIESPRGKLARAADDPRGFEIEPVTLGKALPKYDLVQRFLQERRFAARLSHRIAAFAPDAVISGNAPIDIQKRLRDDLRHTPMVFWVQDIYAFALRHVLQRKMPFLGAVIAARFARVEFATMARSDAVVVITEDFRSILTSRGVPDARIVTVPNWAPLEDLPGHPRDNPWAREHGLVDRFVFLYTGTLGLKHDPSSLVALARSFQSDPSVVVVVVSQGLGRRFLEEAKARHGLENLLLLDYQPFERLPEVMASGDVLTALLEPEASVLSVPSKVLSYLTAGRAILAMMPPENLAARLVESTGAGLLAAPGDTEQFVALAHALHDDCQRGHAMGAAARRYAEETFDIDRIGALFMDVLQHAKAATSSRSPRGI